MNPFNRERVRESLKYSDDGLHQALLDIAYDEWQEHNDWSMEDMLQYALEYGSVVQLAVLLGKYNQQVTNGGHSQYFDNGYSGKHEGNFGQYYNYDTPLSVRMLHLMRKFKLNDTPNGQVVAECIGEFINRTHAFDKGEHAYSHNDEEGDEDEMPNYDDIDNKYFKVYEAWMKDLERYFKLWMEHNEDPIATGRF